MYFANFILKELKSTMLNSINDCNPGVLPCNDFFRTLNIIFAMKHHQVNNFSIFPVETIFSLFQISNDWKDKEWNVLNIFFSFCQQPDHFYQWFPGKHAIHKTGGMSNKHTPFCEALDFEIGCESGRAAGFSIILQNIIVNLI